MPRPDSVLRVGLGLGCVVGTGLVGGSSPSGKLGAGDLGTWCLGPGDPQSGLVGGAAARTLYREGSLVKFKKGP